MPPFVSEGVPAAANWAEQTQQVNRQIRATQNGTKPVEFRGNMGSTEEVENDLCPSRIVELQGHSRGDQDEEAYDDQEMAKAIYGTEARIKLAVGIIPRAALFRPKCRGVFGIRDNGAAQPKERMHAPNPERAHDETRHDDECPIEERVVLAVTVVGMRAKTREASRRILVAPVASR